MRMLRVWGGGIYEDDAFYELCDELGLLVWQDFMFACGMYPAHDEFLESVRAEAVAQVKRLRHYACLALWCGNNEDYQIAESLNAYDSSFDGDFRQTAFPAREIYERLLPRLCAELDPTRPYWQGSPYGGASVFDQTVGDRHTWDVWHGVMADYQDYPRYGGRFISEFGMQALPNLPTIEAFCAPEDRTLESAALRYHNKATDGELALESLP
jgi:beta-mannosidase